MDLENTMLSERSQRQDTQSVIPLMAKEREGPVCGEGKLEKPVESGLEGFRNSMLFS